LGAEQTGSALLSMLLPVSTASNGPIDLHGPIDLRLVVHDTLSDSYESSTVLLAKAGFDGTLQLLTSAWERALGYAREEFKGKTLLDLMWSNPRSAAAAAAAILDALNMSPVDLRLRCANGSGKSLTLHRLYDKGEHTMYIVAEECPDPVASGNARTHRPDRATLASTRAASKAQELTVNTPSPFDKPLEQSTGRKFAQMTRGQKCIFVVKLVVCIATFGFVFPNVQHD